MKIAVVDYGDNIKVLKSYFEGERFLRRYWLESIELKPIVVYDTEAQRKEVIENLGNIYDNVNELIVTYDKGLERLREVGDDISVLIISESLGREGAGLELISAVREGDLGEKLKDIPIAIIACGDPMSPHQEKLKKLNINLFIDYLDKTYLDALLELIKRL